MKLKEVEKILDSGRVWADNCPDYGEREVRLCHASDLMSDVLTFIGPGSLLLTGLTNAQVVRTAEVSDFIAICFVRGKEPQPDAVQLAAEKGIPLLGTTMPMYESCGRLFAEGLPGVKRKDGAESCRPQK